MKINILLFLVSVIQLNSINPNNHKIYNSILSLKNTFVRVALAKDILKYKYYCNNMCNKTLSIYDKLI